MVTDSVVVLIARKRHGRRCFESSGWRQEPVKLERPRWMCVRVRACVHAAIFERVAPSTWSTPICVCVYAQHRFPLPPLGPLLDWHPRRWRKWRPEG
eukprot:1652577-Amphidinium_carterae.1